MFVCEVDKKINNTLLLHYLHNIPYLVQHIYETLQDQMS